jgi:hypothetical protein
MKRINPQTGEPYKRGFQNENGLYFIQYLTKKLDKEGYFKLKWGPKEWIARSNKIATKWQKDNKEISNKRNAAQRLRNKGRARELLTNAKNRAKEKNLDFNLTKLWVLQKLDAGVCELSGIPFDLQPTDKTHFNPFSPSIDKIDAKKGYTFDNSRVIITSLNMALGEYGLDLYLQVAKKVIKHQKRKL